MPVINVSLPEPVRDWIEAKVERGDYASVSDDLGELICRDQMDTGERDALVEALIKGERSGVSSRQVPEIMTALRSERRGKA